MAEFHERFPFTFVIMLGDNMYGSEEPDDFERKFRDPNGIIFDINWKGWTMTTGKVKSAAARKKIGKKVSTPAKTGKNARKK